MITSFFKPKNTKETATVSLKRPAVPVMQKDSIDNGNIDGLEITSSSSVESANKNNRGEASSSTSKRLKKDDTSVQELLKFLEGEIDNSNPNSTIWRKALDKHFSSQQFEKLAHYVATQRKSATVYPPPEDVFSALTLTPLDQVKLVIIGQDPYHAPSQAHGLCFSVKKGVQIPPSLRNIYKELQNDPNVDFPRNGIMPTHGYLERWARQGVLMLNTVLTVRRGEANSHKNKGWENVTDEVLRVLAREKRKSGQGLVYLLWGKPASQKIESVLGRNNTNQTIISTSHPSPLGATKTNSPFLGSKCFSRANEALKEMGLEPIDWNVDGDLVDV